MYKNKIIHIITSLNDGGAEGVLTRLIINSPKHTLHEVVCLGGSNKYGNILNKNNIKVHILNMKLWSMNISKIIYLHKLLNKKKNFTVQTWLYHADFLGGILAKISGIKNIIWNIRTSEINFQTYKFTTFLIILACAILSWFIPSKIIICSKRSMTIHSKIGYKNIFHLIQNGFQLKKSNKKKILELKKKLSIKEAFVIGNVSRYHPQKNHFFLLECFQKFIKKNSNSILVLVGSNLDKKNKELQEKIKTLNLKDRVVLLGQRDDINDIYQLFDFFILPSSSEGFPNVLAEAMLNKIPCCSSDVGDAKEILGNDGWIISSTNHSKTINVLNKAYKMKSNQKLWNNRKNRCRERILKRFPLKKMIFSYSKIWSLCKA